MDLKMKVQPQFVDGECSIVFSLLFNQADKQVGEAIILTCEEEMDAQLIEEKPYLTPKKRTRADRKVAFVTEFMVNDRHKNAVLKEIKQFLRIIGIQHIRFPDTQVANLA